MGPDNLSSFGFGIKLTPTNTFLRSLSSVTTCTPTSIPTYLYSYTHAQGVSERSCFHN